ncbi:MAG TPA: von Willebrand factor type A domain-containing protein [Anaerolineales bacterium]|nr:von Willebrand factor type A domain-containing protein [Anaerolineales bacterium]
MSTKRTAIPFVLVLVLVLTSACAPAATPQITSAPALETHKEVAPEFAAPATSAPALPYAAATQAPAAPSFSTNQSQLVPAPTMASGAPAQGIWSYTPSQTNPNTAQGAYDTFFQNYGVNPRIDTQDDHLSTFGLDVDTGSYSIMRSYINQGSLPPADSVRVEEYVNYFDQGYPYPPEGKAFGINIDGGPSPFEENQNYQIMRIGLQGYAVSPADRKDVSLTFVIDVSGSMNMDNRLGLVKRSLALLVKQLRPSDRVSLVIFGTQAQVILPPTAGSRTQRIMQAIDRLQPGGVTNAEAGLLLGYQMADEAFNPDGINRVILCSDGGANLGETDAGPIWNEIEEYAGKQITLTTVGFGMDNYNDVLMEQLADKGNGFYAYVDDIQEARRLFIENLTSTLQVIALDAKVQVDFNPEVVSRYRLIGFENRAIADRDFRNDNVTGGQVGAGHSVTALYEIKLNPEAQGRIATVHLRWQDPDTLAETETARSFSTDQLASSFNRTDPHFQWSLVVAEYAEVLRNSYWAKNISLNQVESEAVQVGNRLSEDEDVAEFVNLVHQAFQYQQDGDVSGE